MYNPYYDGGMGYGGHFGRFDVITSALHGPAPAGSGYNWTGTSNWMSPISEFGPATTSPYVKKLLKNYGPSPGRRNKLAVLHTEALGVNRVLQDIPECDKFRAPAASKSFESPEGKLGHDRTTQSLGQVAEAEDADPAHIPDDLPKGIIPLQESRCTISRGRTVVRLQTQKLKPNPGLLEPFQPPKRKKKTAGERLKEKYLLSTKGSRRSSGSRRGSKDLLETGLGSGSRWETVDDPSAYYSAPTDPKASSSFDSEKLEAIITDIAIAAKFTGEIAESTTDVHSTLNEQPSSVQSTPDTIPEEAPCEVVTVRLPQSARIRAYRTSLRRGSEIPDDVREILRDLGSVKGRSDSAAEATVTITLPKTKTEQEDADKDGSTENINDGGVSPSKDIVEPSITDGPTAPPPPLIAPWRKSGRNIVRPSLKQIAADGAKNIPAVSSEEKSLESIDHQPTSGAVTAPWRKASNRKPGKVATTQKSTPTLQLPNPDSNSNLDSGQLSPNTEFWSRYREQKEVLVSPSSPETVSNASSIDFWSDWKRGSYYPPKRKPFGGTIMEEEGGAPNETEGQVSSETSVNDVKAKESRGLSPEIPSKIEKSQPTSITTKIEEKKPLQRDTNQLTPEAHQNLKQLEKPKFNDGPKFGSKLGNTPITAEAGTFRNEKQLAGSPRELNIPISRAVERPAAPWGQKSTSRVETGTAASSEQKDDSAEWTDFWSGRASYMRVRMDWKKSMVEEMSHEETTSNSSHELTTTKCTEPPRKADSPPPRPRINEAPKQAAAAQPEKLAAADLSKPTLKPIETASAKAPIETKALGTGKALLKAKSDEIVPGKTTLAETRLKNKSFGGEPLGTESEGVKPQEPTRPETPPKPKALEKVPLEIKAKVTSSPEKRSEASVPIKQKVEPTSVLASQVETTPKASNDTKQTNNVTQQGKQGKTMSPEPATPTKVTSPKRIKSPPAVIAKTNKQNGTNSPDKSSIPDTKSDGKVSIKPDEAKPLITSDSTSTEQHVAEIQRKPTPEPSTPEKSSSSASLPETSESVATVDVESSPSPAGSFKGLLRRRLNTEGSTSSSSTTSTGTGSWTLTGSSSSGSSTCTSRHLPSPPPAAAEGGAAEDDSSQELSPLQGQPQTTRPKYRTYHLNDFTFLKVLGKGSFGKVLLAELKGSGSYYAVKCLKKDVVLEDDDVECTMIERKVLLIGSKHPYLCHLLCTFQSESHLFFVMEYLNGGDLMFHIQQSGRFSEERTRFYAAEILSGLQFLHKKGVIYRDLKLDNILLDYEGHVRIADFGMCKLQIYLDRTADTFCGTPDYMAPEIIHGMRYNQSVDYWAYGVLLYEMLLGQSPFSGRDEEQLFWSICNEPPHYPRFIPRESKKILELLLEKDGFHRLGSPGCAHGDIRNQPFFSTIDWEKLERRELEPPFKPKLRDPADVKYFDTSFTRENPRLTPVDKEILRSMDQNQFNGFSYTNPHTTD